MYFLALSTKKEKKKNSRNNDPANNNKHCNGGLKISFPNKRNQSTIKKMPDSMPKAGNIQNDLGITFIPEM